MSDPLMDAFSLKDMMLSVLAKLDRMDNKLDSKADEAMVQGLEQRIGMLERVQQGAETRAAIVVPQIADMRSDLNLLRDNAATNKAVDAYKRWLFGTAAVGFVGMALTIAQATGVLK